MNGHVYGRRSRRDSRRRRVLRVEIEMWLEYGQDQDEDEMRTQCDGNPACNQDVHVQKLTYALVIHRLDETVSQPSFMPSRRRTTTHKR